MTKNLSPLERERPRCLRVVPVETDHHPDLGRSHIPHLKPRVARREEQRFFEKEMSFAITADESGRADYHRRVVIGPSRPLWKSCDNDHATFLCDVKEAHRCLTGRNRFRELPHLLLCYKLVTGRAEIWEEEQVRLGVFELRRDVIEILSHFSEQWRILEDANS